MVWAVFLIVILEGMEETWGGQDAGDFVTQSPRGRGPVQGEKYENGRATVAREVAVDGAIVVGDGGYSDNVGEVM